MQHTTMNTKCGQAGCDRSADHEYDWPGRGRLYACEMHANKAVAIGKAVGVSIQLTKLPNFTQPELKSVLRMLETTLGQRAAKEVLATGRVPAKTTIVCEVCYTPIAIVDDNGVAYAYSDELDKEEFALLQLLVKLQVISIALQDAKVSHCPHCVACLCAHCT